jgi:hypothetical protein
MAGTYFTAGTLLSVISVSPSLLVIVIAFPRVMLGGLVEGLFVKLNFAIRSSEVGNAQLVRGEDGIG